MDKRIAIVTGARRGIGLGITKALAREGYHVVMVSSSKIESVKEVLEQLRQEGISVSYVACDISNKEDREYLVQEVCDKYKRIDVLVNNAGVAPIERVPLLEMSEESFDRVIGINLKGTLFMSQLVAKAMINVKRNNPGISPRIINISSISAYTSSSNRGEYCISKSGIAMVTKIFADALAEYEIPVFEVRPGIIMTDMTKGVRDKYEAMIENGLTPIKRIGAPEDVAKCVVAACSGLLDFGTGQVLNADGGFHLRRL